MGAFDLKSLLSSSSLSASNTKDESTKQMKVTHISVYDLVPSKDNFYAVEDINDLKDSIDIFGIKQNITVRPIEGGKYRVIAGHRRRLASLALVEEGKQEHKMVPCVIETDLDDIKEQLLLIATNATTRKLTDWEKTEQAKRMRELLNIYKKQEKIPGRIRDLIAKVLDTSPAQVGRMESIANKLSEPFQEEFQQQNLNISTAYEISTLPDEAQEEILDQYKDTGTLSIKDVKVKKEELKGRTITQQEQQASEQNQGQSEQYSEERSQSEVRASSTIDEMPPEIMASTDNPPTTKPTIPDKIFPTVHEVLMDMSKLELAQLICQRCDGSGFCDFFTECCHGSMEDRPTICMKWLGMEVQKGR